VIDFAFVSATTNRIFSDSYSSSYYQWISGASGFQLKDVEMYGIPPNYLNVVDTEFYIPTHLEKDACTSTLPDGKLNATSALYNDIGIQKYPVGDQDIYNITNPQ
jgi:hypothetical protein